MNPTEILQILVSTLAMGAAARQQNAHAVVKSAYEQLRNHLEKVYPDLDVRVVEQRPDSPARRAVLLEELEKTQAADDATLLGLAAGLSEVLARHQAQAAQVVAVDLQEVRAKLARFRQIESSGDGLRVAKSAVDEMEVESVSAGGKQGASGADTLQVSLEQSQINTLIVTLGKQTPAEVRALSVAYLHRLIDQLNLLPLGGVDKKAASNQAASMQLSAVYTALLTETNDELLRPSGGAKVDKTGDEQPSRRSAVEQLNRERKLVLLGDPGSGKSAFVNFVALCMAGALLEDEQVNLALLTAPLPPDKEATQGNQKEKPKPQPWDHGALLPVRIVLRDWAASHLPAVGEKATASHLWNFLEVELEKAKLGDFAEPLRKHLLEKGGLVLLDGLDEAPEADGRRVQIKEAVEDFAASFPKCRLLVTSRTYAYQQPDWRLQGFAVSLLAAFSNGQIRHFVDRWYAHRAGLLGEDVEKAQARADELKAALFANPRLHELAVRPLLLALTASLHAWRNGQLPNNREELYADAVDLLLEQWEAQRMDPRKRTVGQPSLAAFLEVGREKMLVLLQRLAYQAHANQQQLSGAADIGESDLVAGLLELSDRADLQPRQLINYLSQRAGLLYERGSKIYTFPHRTFQEYLAACHLTSRTRFPSEMADLLRSDPNRWREVTLLAAAKAKGGAIYTFWALIDRLSRPGDRETGGQGDKERGRQGERERERERESGGEWGMLLAGQAIDEGIDLATLEEEESERVTRVRRGLVQVIEGNALPAVERALAGRILAHLGDPRPAVMTVGQMEFCAIAAGPFADSNAKQKARKKAQAGALPYVYWMSRYPVTNAQYKAFMAAQGYTSEGYWPEAQKAGYWSKEGFKGLLDNKPRTAPYAYREPFSLANHPVVGVTWYEAVAFCHWLSAQLSAPGWSVRLPSEAEWAKAAVGGLETPATPLRIAFAEQDWLQAMPALTPNAQPQRRYPWGDDFSPELANGQESSIGATSAVGCFGGGASPYGVEELSGNVWEWLWQAPGDMAGGAYWNDAGKVVSAARRWGLPYYRNDFLGFRCVVVPISRS